MMKVYLAGPITGTADNNIWRQRAVDLLDGIETINPLDFEVNHRDPRSIVVLDYELILNSGYVLAYIGKQSWGTAMEIAFAHQHKIPVYGWGISPRHAKNESPWLRHHVTYFFGGLEEAANMIKTGVKIRSWE